MEDNLYERIRQIVAQIPAGKVATYGQIAKLAGIKDARLVGRAISGNKDPSIPCHRVVKQDGGLAVNYSQGDWREDKAKLLAEGIEFTDETTINLSKHLWQPNGKN